jgi:hypothetical protein
MATKRKTTVYIDDDVLRATKVFAARTGQREYSVVNEALRSFLGLAVVDEVWGQSNLTEDESLALAYDELRAMRREDAAGK